MISKYHHHWMALVLGALVLVLVAAAVINAKGQ